MEDEATIINLRRACGHERMARCRAKQKKEKRAAERIREREAALTIINLRRSRAHECMARSRAKQKEAKRAAERRIRECEVEAGADDDDNDGDDGHPRAAADDNDDGEDDNGDDGHPHADNDGQPTLKCLIPGNICNIVDADDGQMRL